MPIGSVVSYRDYPKPYFSRLYETNKAGRGTFPLSLRAALLDDICFICEYNTSPAFYAPPVDNTAGFAPRTPVDDYFLESGSIEVNEFIRLKILDLYCA